MSAWGRDVALVVGREGGRGENDCGVLAAEGGGEYVNSMVRVGLIIGCVGGAVYFFTNLIFEMNLDPFFSYSIWLGFGVAVT